MILLENKIESLPKFISAQKLLEDKFILEFSNNGKNIKNITRTIELHLGEIAYFVKLDDEPDACGNNRQYSTAS